MTILPWWLAQVRQMRTWMADHGYRDTPLWVTEYGILMPADYGFSPARVAAFLVATFDDFRTACDPALGLPTDGNRLVQRWLWFSAYAADFPTGNLFAADGQPTPLMGTLALLPGHPSTGDDDPSLYHDLTESHCHAYSLSSPLPHLRHAPVHGRPGCPDGRHGP